ncbi:hypothetical protein KY290_033463 [Solanum tuberosum]|uniref:Uncharacterized protein n=1 Tax=Solanum tuberosum TaxID=4113 RepID=A0ABQ7U406_SOLTU|nr:hypothetical protein KY290_033463 [Solanum tuberosum]
MFRPSIPIQQKIHLVSLPRPPPLRPTKNLNMNMKKKNLPSKFRNILYCLRLNIPSLSPSSVMGRDEPAMPCNHLLHGNQRIGDSSYFTELEFPCSTNLRRN